MRRTALRRGLIATCLGLCAAASAFEPDGTIDHAGDDALPVIAIIIDDLGHATTTGRRAIALPGPVALSVLPHTPHARLLAREAHASGKEVMLHLPLEALASNQYLGPGAMMLDMTRGQFAERLLHNLNAVPYASGVNNHMGSLLTRHPGHMAWLMQELKRHEDLFFVDSRTTQRSVALKLAVETGVPAARRDVFLDHDRDPERVAEQLEMLKAVARRDGAAIGIGHPHAVTMAALEDMLPALRQTGFRLIGVRDLIDRRVRRAAPRQGL